MVSFVIFIIVISEKLASRIRDGERVKHTVSTERERKHKQAITDQEVLPHSKHGFGSSEK